MNEKYTIISLKCKLETSQSKVRMMTEHLKKTMAWDDYCYKWDLCPCNGVFNDSGIHEEDCDHIDEQDDSAAIDAEIAQWDAEQNKPLTEEEIVLSEFEEELHDYIINGDDEQ
jgi:hypothetical protein